MSTTDEQHHVAESCTSSSSSNSSSSSSSSDTSTTSWDEPVEEETPTWQSSQPQEDENDDVNSPEKERQLLLLMLLAQVCALHDPSPKTFTVHVLELFERGILDRESIRFLFELGLVPSHSAPSTPLLLSEEDVMKALTAAEQENARHVETALSIIPPPTRTMSMEQVRAQEASAIRLHLEQSHQHHQHDNTTTASPPHCSNSWAVEHHPLSLSRFQREFQQVSLLSQGAFGQVFHVVSKLDGTEYAVKRVAFGVHGYHSESITQAVREVTCLAQCHHPHCVRYYTSWLEPSWMTGSSVGVDETPLLLTNGSSRNISSSIMSRRASFSFGTSNNEYGYDLDKDWTGSKDDSFLGATYSSNNNNRNNNRNNNASPPNYRYEICLFIQMQLCTSSTLADWIRQRNLTKPPVKARAGRAIQIFTQVLHGMAHVHSKQICHRDLKPQNIFVGLDGNFLVGDFGLSRILASGRRHAATRNTMEPLTVGIGTASYAAPEQLKCRQYGIEADIFSLGLILLELFCVFETEHERLDTFQKCRCQSLPEWLVQEYPHVAKIVKRCTSENPLKRPTAADLCNKVLTKEAVLRMQLKEKEKQLEKQRSEIDEKDKIIQELRNQVQEMSMRQVDGGDETSENEDCDDVNGKKDGTLNGDS